MAQFLILADDYKDAEALNRRLSVREDHLKRMKTEKAEGRFVVGGAKLNEGKMVGSMLVVNLDDEETVRNWIEIDPYVTGKVWENIQVVPFKIADV
jgi:uncharacterized protein YciI